MQIISPETAMLLEKLEAMRKDLNDVYGKIFEVRERVENNEKRIIDMKRQVPIQIMEEKLAKDKGVVVGEADKKVYEVIKLREKVMKKLPTTIQTQTYASAVQARNMRKESMSYVAKTYLENLYTMIKYLNKNAVSEDFDKVHGFTVQSNQGYNKLIGLIGCGPKLIKNSYNYGLLATVYTKDGTELVELPEIYKIFKNYKRITHAELYYVRVYSAPAEVCEQGIKEKITVVKIGITKEILLPEEVQEQPEVRKEDLIEFIRRKRIIQMAQIVKELVSVYNKSSPIWISSNRNQELIYTQGKDTREKDMEEIENWILTLLRPDDKPRTRAINQEFISEESKDYYCRIIGREYVKEHQCTKCNEGTSKKGKAPLLEWDEGIKRDDETDDEDNTEEPIMNKERD